MSSLTVHDTRSTQIPAKAVQPVWVRIVHWINAVAMVMMIMSGWQIYNASPLFDFTFSQTITLGGWLGGALLWHFAAMWLLMVNGLVYLVLGFATGRHVRFALADPAAIARRIEEVYRGDELEVEEETRVDVQHITPNDESAPPALTDDNSASISALVDELLAAGGKHVKLVTLAPEVDRSSKLTRHLVERNILVAAGHTNAQVEDLERAIDAGNRMANDFIILWILEFDPVQIWDRQRRGIAGNRSVG